MKICNHKLQKGACVLNLLAPYQKISRRKRGAFSVSGAPAAEEVLRVGQRHFLLVPKQPLRHLALPKLSFPSRMSQTRPSRQELSHSVVGQVRLLRFF